MMEGRKVTQKIAGGVLISVGCACKLAEWGLSASEVVFNGAENMTNSFVKAPEFGIGKAAFGAVEKSVSVLSKTFIEKGKRIAE